jgi:large subunit ribosomal protein L4
MRDGEVKVVENLELPQPKTRAMATILENLGVPRTFLIVVDDYDEVLWRCTRNIPGSAMMTVQELNPYQVLRPREVIFTKAAFDSLLERAEKITARTEESAEPVEAAEEGE